MKNNFKLSVFICMFFFCLFLPKLEAGQELPFPSPGSLISMDFQDASLKDILKIFSVQSGLNFIASDTVKDRKFTLYFDSVSIKDAMDKIFLANNLSYDLDKKSNIFIVNDLGAPEVVTITKVFFLKYASVSNSNIISERNNTKVITKLSDAGGGDSSSSGSSSGASSSKGICDVITKLLSGKGTIIEEPRTNSIIVNDIPSRMPMITEVIASLDIPQQQVLLEVEMMDVLKSTTDKIGLKFGDSPLTLNTVLKGALWGTKFPFGSPFGNRNYNYGVDGADNPQYGSFDVNNATPSTYQIVLNFIKTQSDTKYLARPRILTLNNETAEIKIVSDEAIGEKTTQSGGGSVTPTTTAEAERGETGVLLRVTPQINAETNEITMFIIPAVSSASSGIVVGTQQTKDVEVRYTKSMIRVKDGETIVLGGLIRRQYANTDTKLPFFGDLPLVGRFFTNKRKDTDKDRELLVFITPHILKDTPIQLAQAAKKGVLPEREQSTVSRVDRQGVIDASLQNFERKKKK